MSIIISLLQVIIVCFLVHEGGHYIMALSLGHKLKLSFVWEKSILILKIPRYIWTMPDVAEWKKWLIAISGFGAEIGLAVVLFIFWPCNFSTYYLNTALVRFIFYQFYAGESNDLKYFKIFKV